MKQVPRRKIKSNDDGQISVSTSNGELVQLKKQVNSIRPGKLKLNMIDSGTPVKVNYRGEIISITEGWPEFVLLMLGYIYDCYPTSFMKALERGHVTSQNFDVTKYPPAYNSYNNEKYMIPNSPYYLMTNMTPSAVLKAVQGFPEALEIEDEDLLLTINPDEKFMKNIRMVNSVQMNSNIVPLCDIDNNDLDSYTFTWAYIWDTRIKVNNFDDLAIRLVKNLIKTDKKNLQAVLNASIPPVVGVKAGLDEADNNLKVVDLKIKTVHKNSNSSKDNISNIVENKEIKQYYYYSNLVKKYTLAYILRVLDNAGLPKSCVKIKVDQLSIEE